MRRTPVLALQIAKALMSLVATAEPDGSAWFERELRQVLVRYLTAALGASRSP